MTTTLAPVCLVLVAGCNDMWSGAKLRPLARSEVFADGNSSRPLVVGTVARGQARLDTAFYEGRVNGTLVDAFPIRITKQVLDRGQERYGIYCSPCHALTGEGNGMIVQRGFSPPPSYFIPRLIHEPIGHFYDVITNGYGAMYSYNDRIEPEDRWAIVAYIRALQLGRQQNLADVPPDERKRMVVAGTLELSPGDRVSGTATSAPVTSGGTP